MAEKLTPQQRQAVENRGGKLLISAAAGSGKTKVLVDRLLSYLTDPVNPANLDEFLIITYTKAAASELRGKIAAKLTEKIAEQPDNRHLQRQMQRLFLTKISTVHGFCGDILREFAYRLDLAADFRVADENECREIRETVVSELLDRAYQHAGEDADFRAFVDTQGLGRTDSLVAELILKVYDSARCHLNPDAWLQECVSASDISGVSDAGETVWGRYLMEQMFSYLDQQLAVMGYCVQMTEESDGMEKPAAVLRDTLYQMEHLRAAETWDEVVQRKTVDFGRLTFPRKNVDTGLAEQIKACRGACKKGLEKYQRIFADPSELVLEDLAASSGAARGLVRLVKQFGDEYSRVKRMRRVLDFSDLEHKMLDLLLGSKRNGCTAAANEIGSRFREIMVDEYQDSNGVQDAIFEALTGKWQNCFMVGDVKQSIYQFRLADPGIFLEKYHAYKPAIDALPEEGRKVLLSANFRSGPEVIEAVNEVFADCMSEKVGGLVYGEDEMLREGIPHDPLPDPAVEFYGIEVEESTYETEPAFVAERISQMLEEGCLIRSGDGMRPVQPEDIVILLRSPGSVGGYYQSALESKGIRTASGGGTDLLQTEEIGTLRSILQMIANPRQDIPLISALASPVFGFTADHLAEIRSKNKQGAFYDALITDETENTAQFLAVLARLRAEARMNSVAQLIEKIFQMTRLDSIYGAMECGAVKKDNLQAFYALAAEYESTSRRELSQFLEYLELMSEKGLMSAGERTGGAVTIMSIHKSKGLEFPVVFLCSLGREFNRESLRAQVLCDRELGLGLSVADTKNRLRYPAISKRAIAAKAVSESLSEEMRVLYVAMTRARDRLVMTYASRSLSKDLQEMALRMDLDSGKLLIRDAVCPGEWILLNALRRMEAGQLHQMGDRPAQLRCSRYPWKIGIPEGIKSVAFVSGAELQTKKQPEGIGDLLKQSLAFRYPHEAATLAPSKQTATQQKGRIKDREAAENTREVLSFRRSWRAPAFLSGAAQGKTYGSAIHAVMQYIDYALCADQESIRRQVEQLCARRLITEDQAVMVDCDGIAAFFETDLGKKLRLGTPHIREFKFSVLDEGGNYARGLEGEQVLLQGVVDCALLEEDGITVIDFKTDRVSEENLSELTEQYGAQLKTYAHALERIYQKPVRKCCLYFFRLNRTVELS